MKYCLSLLLLALAPPAVAVLPEIDAWTHVEILKQQAPQQSDYLLGLGALQKIGGRWRHKHSEAKVGELTRFTWQINDGFTAVEAYEWLRAQLPGEAELRFSCQGRACGSSAQWAHRVFQERLLYGHDDRQRYGVWRWQQGEAVWHAVFYAVDRANRRHYLHLDLLQVVPRGASE